MKRGTTTTVKETTMTDAQPSVCAARTLLAFTNMVVEEANLSITDQQSEMTMSEKPGHHQEGCTSNSSSLAVPTTVIVAIKHDSDREEEDEERETDEQDDDDDDDDDDGSYDKYFNATSLSGTGVYFRNRELVRTSFHPLQQIGPARLDDTGGLDESSSIDDGRSRRPWPVRTPPAGKPMLPAPALVRHTWTTTTTTTTSINSNSNKSTSQLAAVPLRSSIHKQSYYSQHRALQQKTTTMKSVTTDCMSVSYSPKTSSRPLLPPPFVLGCFS
jgi:hypothetical protein